MCTSCLTATTQSTGAPGAPSSPHGPAAGSRAAMSALQTLRRAAAQVSHRPGEDVAGRGRPHAGARRLGWGKALPALALVPPGVRLGAGHSSGEAPKLGPVLSVGPVVRAGPQLYFTSASVPCQDGKAAAAGAGAATLAAAATPGSAAAKVASALRRHTGLSLLGWGRASDAASPVRP